MQYIMLIMTSFCWPVHRIIMFLLAQLNRKKSRHRIILLASHFETGRYIQAAPLRSLEWLNSSTDWCSYSCRCLTSIMCHVSPYQVSSGQCTAQTKFTGKSSGCDNSCKTTSVLSWSCWVCTFHTKKFEHRRLSFENCTTTDRTDFDTWHRHTDL